MKSHDLINFIAEKSFLRSEKFQETLSDAMINNLAMIKKNLEDEKYINRAAFLGLVDKLVFLIDKGISIYSMNEQGNPLHCAVIGAQLALEKGEKNRLENCTQIFNILLNYEAEQKALNPKAYENIILLKDQMNHLGLKPQHTLDHDKQLLAYFNKAMEEYEQIKAKEIKVEDIVDQNKWQERVNPNLRQRSTAASKTIEEHQPLLQNQNDDNDKSRRTSPQKTEGGWTSSILNFFRNNNSPEVH